MVAITKTTPITFTLTPGSINTSDIVDLNNTQVRDLYLRSASSIQVPFDGDSKSINILQSQFLHKIDNSGLAVGLGMIILIDDDDDKQRNFIIEYVCFLWRDNCESRQHLCWPTITSSTKQSNVARMPPFFYHCKLLHKIFNEEWSYTVTKVTTITSGSTVTKKTKSGALLIKIFMSKVIVDTRAATFQFRNSLESFEDYMTSINSNIEKFNMHVKYAREDLKARGHIIDDLVLKLFKGYTTDSGSKFVEYIEKKEDYYIDGDGRGATYAISTQ